MQKEVGKVEKCSVFRNTEYDGVSTYLLFPYVSLLPLMFLLCLQPEAYRLQLGKRYH
jgi:hypothetical protein